MKQFEEELVQPETIHIFPTGNVFAISEESLQITPLQQINVFGLLFQYMEDNGLDPTKCKFVDPGSLEIFPIKIDGKWQASYIQ